MRDDPMTILITVGKEEGYSVLVSSPRFAGKDQTLYVCEGTKSLFDRLIKVLDLSLHYEIIVKEKEA